MGSGKETDANLAGGFGMRVTSSSVVALQRKMNALSYDFLIPTNGAGLELRCPGTMMDGLELVPTPGLQGVEKCSYFFANYHPSSPPDRYHHEILSFCAGERWEAPTDEFQLKRCLACTCS